MADARRKRRRYEDMLSKQESASPGQIFPDEKKQAITYSERPVDPTPESEGVGKYPWSLPMPEAPTPASTFVIGPLETSPLGSGAPPAVSTALQAQDDAITPAASSTGPVAGQVTVSRPGLERSNIQTGRATTTKELKKS